MVHCIEVLSVVWRSCPLHGGTFTWNYDWCWTSVHYFGGHPLFSSSTILIATCMSVQPPCCYGNWVTWVVSRETLCLWNHIHESLCYSFCWSLFACACSLSCWLCGVLYGTLRAQTQAACVARHQIRLQPLYWVSLDSLQSDRAGGKDRVGGRGWFAVAEDMILEWVGGRGWLDSGLLQVNMLVGAIHLQAREMIRALSRGSVEWSVWACRGSSDSVTSYSYHLFVVVATDYKDLSQPHRAYPDVEFFTYTCLEQFSPLAANK